MKHLDKEIYKLPKGKPFSNKELLKFASYENVRQVLCRLVKKDILTRVTRGIYVRPEEAPFLGKVIPEPLSIVKAIAEKTGEKVLPNGLACANLFGLTTQVPMKVTFITTGTSREVKIGNSLITLKHVSPRKIIDSETKTGLALSALWYLGKENVTRETIEKIKQKLSEEEFEALCKETHRMPVWMAKNFYLYQQEH